MDIQWASNTEQTRLRVFNIIFNSAFILATIIPVWFLPFGVIDRIQAELIFVPGVGYCLYEFQRRAIDRWHYWMWGALFSMGLIVIALAAAAVPAWREAGRFIVEGKFSLARDTLITMPHANLVAFLGFGVCYVAIIGFIRAMLLTIFCKRGVSNRV